MKPPLSPSASSCPCTWIPWRGLVSCPHDPLSSSLLSQCPAENCKRWWGLEAGPPPPGRELPQTLDLFAFQPVPNPSSDLRAQPRASCLGPGAKTSLSLNQNQVTPPGSPSAAPCTTVTLRGLRPLLVWQVRSGEHHPVPPEPHLCSHIPGKRHNSVFLFYLEMI